MKCLQCQHDNVSDAKFCNQCGTPLMAPTSALSSSPSLPQEAASESRFQALIRSVKGMLQRERRVTYRTLKHVFSLEDGLLEEVKEELFLIGEACDEHGKVLVWTGETQPAVPAAVKTLVQPQTAEASSSLSPDVSTLSAPVTEADTQSNGPATFPQVFSTDARLDEPVATPEGTRSVPQAERRQLTVMFCDLIDSTDLSGKLDPEDLREVVRAYQETAAGVIQRYEGHIAQYLGDGLLIYFGFPVAHEDDAPRAVYTGLGIPEAMAALNARLEADYGVQLAVRIGIHTGPVVVGEMGGGGRHENLALGETPNIAARLEGLAQANTAVISPVTAQLVQRSFVLEELGPHELKGVADPMMLYAVVEPREVEPDDHEAMIAGRFDALVGRDEEIGLLVRRWEQTKEGQGQVVLISGEAGLGKSSLVEGLRAHAQHEGYHRIAFRCSQYTQNSSLYPVIEHLQRVFRWQRDDRVETKLAHLEQSLARTSLHLEESVPLLAALLSLPLPQGRYPALTLPPQQQRQQTHDTLVAWILEEAERQPLLAVWEDLHWADPSTLELLGLFIDQAATVPMMNVLAYRPQFAPPWPAQSHLTPLPLNRLERSHIEALVRRLAGGKTLPAEVEGHIVTKTDGVPLYVEELTKMLLESDLLQEEAEQYVLTGPLSDASIPATLQDSLMARLDRLPTVKEVAQLGAVLGREFAYEMLHALSAVEEAALQEGLGQLVDTELLYQRGRIPRARYIFRHVLIRDTAYQSLLRRTRQQYHEQVAQLLEARFPDIVEIQPELVAHHYTESGRTGPAVVYWQRAGDMAVARSAHAEAIHQFRAGLAVMKRLPETPERCQQELALQIALGTPLAATQGYASPEVERVYTRARELCRQLGDGPQLFPVLSALALFYVAQGAVQTARELSDQLVHLAEQTQAPSPLLEADYLFAIASFWGGEFALARQHLEAMMARYDPSRHGDLVFCYGEDPRIQPIFYHALTLWIMGYPDQARRQHQAALSHAHAVASPHNLAFALNFSAIFHLCCREASLVYTQAETEIALATEQGFPHWIGAGTTFRGWARAVQGEGEEGIAEIHQGLSVYQATGAQAGVTWLRALLAEAYGHRSQPKAGRQVLAEARADMEGRGERVYEAELYRLQGDLLLRPAIPDAPQAEASFQQALNIARQQLAKSWELRVAMSLSRLWQQQGKRDEARELLAPLYGWFTEGFDSADLKEATVLLDELRA